MAEPESGPVDAADPRIHEVAQAFGAVARLYEKARPEYADEAIDYLVDRLSLSPQSRLLELAAGTGVLTRALVRRGLRPIAVEPSVGMRAEFVRQLPNARLLDATAERVPLPDGSVDAVVIGQAFHWFRIEEALAEIDRVLGRGGGFALLYNFRDDSVPWVAEFSGIIREHRPPALSAGWDRAFSLFKSHPRFAPVEERSFPFVQRIDNGETLVARALSVSYIARLKAGERESVTERVRALVRTREASGEPRPIDLPHRTEVTTTHTLP